MKSRRSRTTAQFAGMRKLSSSLARQSPRSIDRNGGEGDGRDCNFSGKFAHGIKLNRDFIFCLRCLRCRRLRNADRRSRSPPFLRSFVRYPPVKTAKSLLPSAVRPSVPPSLRPSVPPSLRPSVPPGRIVNRRRRRHRAASLLLRALYPPLFALTPPISPPPSLPPPPPSFQAVSLPPALSRPPWEVEAISHSKYAHQSDMDSPPLSLPLLNRRQLNQRMEGASDGRTEGAESTDRPTERQDPHSPPPPPPPRRFVV